MSWNPQQGWPPESNQQPFSQPAMPQYPYAPPQQGWPAGNQQPLSQPGAPQYPYTAQPQQFWAGWQADMPAAPIQPSPRGAPKTRTFSALIKNLPSQYLSALIHPSEESFFDISKGADWRAFWLHMVVWLLISALFTVANLTFYHHGWKPPAGKLSPLQLQLDDPRSFLNIAFTLFSSQIGFLIYAGISYLFARLFGGKGAFLEHYYTTLVIAVLVGTLSYIGSMIPLVGSISGFLFFIYQAVLYIVAIKSIHNLSGCMATLTVALLAAVVLVGFLLIAVTLLPGSF